MLCFRKSSEENMVKSLQDKEDEEKEKAFKTEPHDLQAEKGERPGREGL